MSQQVLERPTPSEDSLTPQQAAEAAAKKFPPLTAQDRCDAAVVRMVDGAKEQGTCGAQAFVRVVMPSGYDLLFCGHCVGELTSGKRVSGAASAAIVARRQALKDAGAHFVSTYHTINLKPTDTTPQTPNGF